MQPYFIQLGKYTQFFFVAVGIVCCCEVTISYCRAMDGRYVIYMKFGCESNSKMRTYTRIVKRTYVNRVGNCGKERNGQASSTDRESKSEYGPFSCIAYNVCIPYTHTQCARHRRSIAMRLIYVWILQPLQCHTTTT